MPKRNLYDNNNQLFIIQNSIIDEWVKVIGPGAFTVYCLLKRMCVGQELTTFDDIKQKDWAEYIGISRSSFRKHITTLVQYNLIDVIPPKGSDRLQHKPTRYILNRLDEGEL